MPTHSTRRANAASRNDTIAPARKKSLGPIRKNTGPSWPKCFNADRLRPYPPGPIVAPEVIAELQREHRAIQLDLLLLKRDLAWQDVIDKAIRMCRLLRDAELAEIDAKYRPDQPRVPAGNPDGGQWVDVGGGGGTTAADVAATAPADATINLDEAARRAAQAADNLRQLLQAGGRIVTAAGAATSALAVGILMATATPLGGTRQEQVETLADGTIVTVVSYGNTPDKTIRAESPDGTVTYATIAINKNGSVKVVRGEVSSPDGGRQPIDPNAFAVAAGALINAATGGGGGKTKPGSPDKSGVAATPPPEDEDPDYASKEPRLPAHLRNKIDRIENATAAGGRRSISGSVTEREARSLGERFVGRGYRVTRGSKGEEILVSRDGLRQYRGPTDKRGIDQMTNQPWGRTGRRVNFETRAEVEGRWQSNVHLDIK